MKLAGHSDGRQYVSNGKTYDLGKRVRRLCFTADGKRLVSGGDDHTVRVWDLATGKAIRAFSAESTHDVTCLAVSSDGRYVLSGHGSYGGVKLWDLEAGVLARDLLPTTMYIDAVGFAGVEPVAAKGGTRMWAWKLDGTVKKAPKDDSAKRVPCAIAPDGKVLAAQIKGGAKLAAIPGGKKLRDLSHDAEIKCLAFDATGAHVAAGDEGGGWSVWNVATGEVVGSKVGGGEFDDRLVSIALSPDGSKLAFGHGRDGVTVATVDGAIVAEHAISRMTIEALAFSPDGKRLAAGEYDGFIHLLDV
jgi:WD40 repeat protein